MNKDGFEYKIIKASTIEDFNSLCKESFGDGYIYVGALNVSKVSREEYMFSQQWVRKEDEKTTGKIDFVILKDSSTVEFSRKCEKHHEKDFMFTSQLVVVGLGQGKFEYVQQWVKRESNEIIEEGKEDETKVD